MAAEYEPFLEQESKRTSIDSQSFPTHQNLPARRWIVKALAVIAILSTFGNIAWVIQAFRNTSVKSLHRLTNEGYEQNAAWENWVVDPGIVALPHAWVKENMLPRAQHWPWDGDKGVYLLNGFHNIHCLQLIRKALIDAAEGRTMDNGHYSAAPLEHNLHCIESLRVSVRMLCVMQMILRVIQVTQCDL